jgi:hypothetical protein
VSTPIGSAAAVASPTIKPSAAPSLAGPAASCVPVLAVEGGGVVQAAQLRSYAAFPGLNVQGSGATATVYDPDVIMTLQAYPGSAPTPIKTPGPNQCVSGASVYRTGR